MAPPYAEGPFQFLETPPGGDIYLWALYEDAQGNLLHKLHTAKREDGGIVASTGYVEGTDDFSAFNIVSLPGKKVALFGQVGSSSVQKVKVYDVSMNELFSDDSGGNIYSEGEKTVDYQGNVFAGGIRNTGLPGVVDNVIRKFNKDTLTHAGDLELSLGDNDNNYMETSDARFFARNIVASPDGYLYMMADYSMAEYSGSSSAVASDYKRFSLYKVDPATFTEVWRWDFSSSEIATKENRNSTIISGEFVTVTFDSAEAQASIGRKVADGFFMNDMRSDNQGNLYFLPKFEEIVGYDEADIGGSTRFTAIIENMNTPVVYKLDPSSQTFEELPLSVTDGVDLSNGGLILPPENNIMYVMMVDLADNNDTKLEKVDLDTFSSLGIIEDEADNPDVGIFNSMENLAPDGSFYKEDSSGSSAVSLEPFFERYVFDEVNAVLLSADPETFRFFQGVELVETVIELVPKPAA